MVSRCLSAGGLRCLAIASSLTCSGPTTLQANATSGSRGVISRKTVFVPSGQSWILPCSMSAKSEVYVSRTSKSSPRYVTYVQYC